MYRVAGKHLTIVALITMIAVLFGVQTAIAQSDVDDPAEVELGMTIFETNCSGCHGADGMGSQTGRSLIGVATEADKTTHIGSITNGKGNMPAFGENLSDEEISAAASYVRLTFVAEEAELAVTGSTTVPLIVLGVTSMAAGGLIFLLLGRREDEGFTG